MHAKGNERPWTAEEVAEYFRVDVRTINTWVRKGCPSFKPPSSSRRYFYSSAVIKWAMGDEEAA